MNILTNILENSSTYEITLELIYLIALFLTSILTIYSSSKEKKILILSCISLVIAGISNILGIFLVNVLFSVEISSIFKMIPLLTTILVLSNLGLLSGYYISKKEAKRFKISDIREEYVNDNIKQTIFLILLGSSTLLFLSQKTESVVTISILSTIVSMWTTYWISKYILK